MSGFRLIAHHSITGANYLFLCLYSELDFVLETALEVVTETEVETEDDEGFVPLEEETEWEVLVEKAITAAILNVAVLKVKATCRQYVRSSLTEYPFDLHKLLSLWFEMEEGKEEEEQRAKSIAFISTECCWVLVIALNVL